VTFLHDHADVSPTPTAPPRSPCRPGRRSGGDDDTIVLERIYPGLLRYAAMVCPCEDDPEDLVQDALLRTLGSGPLRRLTNPSAYLKRSISNLAANRRRRLGRWRAKVGRIAPCEAGPASYPSDLSFLQPLSPCDRTVLYLAEVEGWTGREIAERLDLTENSVQLRRSRGRSALRVHLRTS
jgi:DNA-directed RNA polymerase specialized sigma24 family protein